MKKSIILLLFLAFNIPFSAKPGNTGFMYRVQDEEKTGLERFFYSVVPGKTIELTVESEGLEAIEIAFPRGEIVSKSSGKWILKAPETVGNYELTISDLSTEKSAVITLFVLVPASQMKGEYLNGYRIGTYPAGKYKGSDKYKKPVGFIEVTDKNKDIYITPHFQLKQFLCKQESGWPKYLVLNPKLLLKLEFLLNELHKEGINAKTLFIMSGYRTPYYNKLIGNVKYSRHVFGDAADIYVDEDKNGVIDDLNNDGKNNMSDAEVLYSIVERLEKSPENSKLIGGMGKYKKNPAHTFFVHVDTRGYAARW
jgi:hypothetical protein